MEPVLCRAAPVKASTSLRSFHWSKLVNTSVSPAVQASRYGLPSQVPTVVSTKMDPVMARVVEIDRRDLGAAEVRHVQRRPLDVDVHVDGRRADEDRLLDGVGREVDEVQRVVHLVDGVEVRPRRIDHHRFDLRADVDVDAGHDRLRVALDLLTARGDATDPVRVRHAELSGLVAVLHGGAVLQDVDHRAVPVDAVGGERAGRCRRPAQVDAVAVLAERGEHDRRARAVPPVPAARRCRAAAPSRRAAGPRRAARAGAHGPRCRRRPACARRAVPAPPPRSRRSRRAAAEAAAAAGPAPAPPPLPPRRSPDRRPASPLDAHVHDVVDLDLYGRAARARVGCIAVTA